MGFLGLGKVWKALGNGAKTAVKLASPIADIVAPGMSSSVKNLINMGSEVIGSQMDQQDEIAGKKDLMSYQNELQMGNWREQQEYNSPKNQLSRLKEAGINPIGQSFSEGNTASSTQAVSPQDVSNLSSIAASQAQARQANANLALLKSQKAGQDLDNKRQEIDNSVAEAEAKEKIAEANSRFQWLDSADSSSLNEFPEGYWEPDENDPFVYHHKEGTDVTSIRMLKRRDKLIVNDIEGMLSESKNKVIQKDLNELSLELQRKYGDKLNDSQIALAVANAYKATQEGKISEYRAWLQSELGIDDTNLWNMLGNIIVHADKISQGTSFPNSRGYGPGRQ